MKASLSLLAIIFLVSLSIHAAVAQAFSCPHSPDTRMLYNRLTNKQKTELYRLQDLFGCTTGTLQYRQVVESVAKLNGQEPDKDVMGALSAIAEVERKKH
jgi:hypothetical protein